MEQGNGEFVRSTDNPNKRLAIADYYISVDQIDESRKWKNLLLQRSIAKEKKFTKVNFSYTIFDICYFRKCSFDSCDFTGCRFVGSNFEGSRFEGCKFDFTQFERTHIESKILDTQCPALENLKQRFARTLRTNYQSLGDVDGVNKAIRVEMDATITHYYKAWGSKETYYRTHYKGWERIVSFMKWLKYRSLEYLWGNGESLWKLVRFVLVVTCLLAFVDLVVQKPCIDFKSYLQSLLNMPNILLGVKSPDYYHPSYLSCIQLFRLIFFALFMAVFVRRMSRR
jgi:hypothetical protein